MFLNNLSINYDKQYLIRLFFTLNDLSDYFNGHQLKLNLNVFNDTQTKTLKLSYSEISIESSVRNSKRNMCEKTCF